MIWFWLFFMVIALFGFVVFFGAPYVPSKRGEVVRAFEELYPLAPDDTLVDIGSGDGIVLRLAAQRGAKAVGYEINPLLVLVSRWLSRSHPRVTVHLASFWSATLPQGTTVVYTFGDSRDIKKMLQKVEETASRLGRPIFFISYAIAVPGVQPVRKVGAHYLYRVAPLQVSEA